ncbi:MAG TPA: hypothetical protein VMG09_18835 [Bacteroidota bacterium]|nr:hypothetical protein [Bacteroidota bacterium]
MISFINKGIRVLLLCAYVPVAVAIGLMHSDDLPAVGDGHPCLSGSHSQSVENVSAHGFCLACQFAAGHIAVAEDQVPVVAPEVTVALTPSVIPVASLVPLESVRGPPSFLSL